MTRGDLTASTCEDSLSVLATAALLEPRTDLDARSRTAVLSHVPLYEVDSPSRAVEALGYACSRAGICLSRKRLPSERSIGRAAALARLWSGRGVFVVRRRGCDASVAERESIPPVLFAAGDRSILHLPAAAILNSRKSCRTGSKDPSIAVTKEMVSSALDRGRAIVASYGNVHYCVVCLLARGSPTVIVSPEVLPFMTQAARVERFESAHAGMFDLGNTVFVSPFPPGSLPASAERQATRDRLVAALSSVILAGRVRARGNIEAIVGDAVNRGVSVERFVPEAQRATVHATPRASDVKECRITGVSARDSVPEHSDRGAFPSAEELAADSHYLIHYTRACPGPWPGETMTTYCRALIENSDGSGHSAFDTLNRILEQGVIHGSARLTRGGVPVVCFTEHLPQDLPPVVEWRRGLRRWTFEPYGVGIRKEVLVKLGARPVIYAVEESFPDLSNDLAYLFQREHPGIKGWSAEREWRINGDTALKDVPVEDVLIIVPSRQEARIVADRHPWRVGLAFRPNGETSG